MAVVYLAEDRRHQRKVALKVLRPELAQSLGGERFLREIQLVAQLNNDDVTTVITGITTFDQFGSGLVGGL